MSFAQISLTAFELALLACLPAITFLTILLFRNPLGPRWLKGRFVQEIGTLMLIVADVVIFCLAAEGMFGAGVKVISGGVLVLGTLAIATVATWVVFGMSRRLADADAGRSPFRSGGVTAGGTPA
ncbi:MAG: hypothetical protein VW268_05005 [Rhodospirillaceae bacterium]